MRHVESWGWSGKFCLLRSVPRVTVLSYFVCLMLFYSVPRSVELPPRGSCGSIFFIYFFNKIYLVCLSAQFVFLCADFVYLWNCIHDFALLSVFAYGTLISLFENKKTVRGSCGSMAFLILKQLFGLFVSTVLLQILFTCGIVSMFLHFFLCLIMEP